MSKRNKLQPCGQTRAECKHVFHLGDTVRITEEWPAAGDRKRWKVIGARNLEPEEGCPCSRGDRCHNRGMAWLVNSTDKNAPEVPCCLLVRCGGKA